VEPFDLNWIVVSLFLEHYSPYFVLNCSVCWEKKLWSAFLVVFALAPTVVLLAFFVQEHFFALPVCSVQEPTSALLVSFALVQIFVLPAFFPPEKTFELPVCFLQEQLFELPGL
jgi:RsiW-degrading membrane proteinase PrsW (M82 family)